MQIDKFDFSFERSDLEKSKDFLRSLSDLSSIAWANRNDDIEQIKNHATSIRSNYKDVVVLGTGGSSLGAKTICDISDDKRVRFHFMDNVDPESFDRLFSLLDKADTYFLSISKSGRTPETIMQTMTAIDWLGDESLVSRHFLFVTEKKQSPLRHLSERYRAACLEHPDDVGGRFSCLTIVGMLPAAIAGVDIELLRKSAWEYYQLELKSDLPNSILGAMFANHFEKQIPINVMMTYPDRLANFGLWYRQLWAESLGKDGRGITPIRALGTADQHSQTQLYLDGPKDKSFTIVRENTKGRGRAISGSGLDYLDGHTMGDLIDAEALATIATFKEKGLPVRDVLLDSVSEKTLGQLLMHFMLETVITANLMGIDAFDQPAVERGKVLTKEYLAA